MSDESSDLPEFVDFAEEACARSALLDETARRSSPPLGSALSLLWWPEEADQSE